MLWILMAPNDYGLLGVKNSELDQERLIFDVMI